MGSPRAHVTVVGLGPAGSAYLSGAVVDLIVNANCAFLRTAFHPARDVLGAVESFDSYYEVADSFDQVYTDIVEALVQAAQAHAPEPIIYAVPGSPLVAERTVEALREDSRVEVTILPGLSFLDLAWERLGVDPVNEGVRLVDAEQYGDQVGGQNGPFLVAQCWSRSLLSEIKLAGNHEDDGARPSVTVLHHLGLDDEVVRTVDWWELDRTVTPDHLTSIYIPALKSPINVGSELSALEELVLTLRARCPWDRAQTHASLMPHLIEESYEVLDALAAISSTDGMATAPDFAHLKEELGDLLFQIVFHSRLAQEEGEFTLADVARGVHEKLVHRHPHVFGGVEADTPDQVVANWEAIKKDEKGRSSVTDGIPAHLPSLMLASKLQRKAGSVGMLSSSEAFDLPQRLAELQALASSAANESADAPLAPDVTSTEVLVGDLLFDVTDLARRVGVDAEQALRSRALSYRDQIVETEASKQSPE